MDLSAKMDQLDLNSEMRRLRLEPRPNERVFEIVPKHFGRMVLPSSLLGGVSAILIVLLLTLANSPWGTPTIYTTVTLFLGTLYLLAVTYTLTQWYGFRHSALIFTNQRIIDADYKNIFTRNIIELDIHAVQNAYGRTDTPLGKTFNYGVLTIDRIGYEPVSFFHVPYPQLAAEQTIHFHNVVAHAGLDTAHNYLASSISDDTTPELEETMEKAVTMAQQPTEPGVDTPTAERGSKVEVSGEKKKRLTFAAPSQKIGQILKEIQSEKEPTVSYLPPQDAFEIEAIILEDQEAATTDKLRQEGVEKIESREELAT